MIKDYCIGSDRWNGLSKLIEELGELQQVNEKLIGSGGETDHWSGDLRAKYIEEIGDVMAAVDFFLLENFTDDEIDAILEQADKKNKLFCQWSSEIRIKEQLTLAPISV